MSTLHHAEIECKNCGNRFDGKYCPQCGQGVAIRITFKSLWKLLAEDMFDWDRGLIHTTRELWTSPGITAVN